jgi:4-hydroxybenzoyl-CoA reductase subunit alpha
VHLVLTGRDFPVPFGILPVSQDEHPLAPEQVRYVGDPVAAVIAGTSRPPARRWSSSR